MVQDKFKASYNEQMDKMTEQLKEETLLLSALKAHHGQPTTASGNNSQGQVVNRTTGSPEWCGEFPWNFRKTVPTANIPLADFEGTSTFPD